MYGVQDRIFFRKRWDLATMIEDIHTMLTSDDPKLDSLTYMKKLK